MLSYSELLQNQSFFIFNFHYTYLFQLLNILQPYFSDENIKEIMLNNFFIKKKIKCTDIFSLDINDQNTGFIID